MVRVVQVFIPILMMQKVISDSLNLAKRVMKMKVVKIPKSQT